MDYNIINQFNERQELACKLIFYALYPKYLTKVKKIVVNRHEAEDMVIKVMAGMFRSEIVFKDYGGIEAYVYYGVMNAIKNYNNRRVYEELINEDEFEDYISEEREPKNSKRLQALINLLPEKYKQILLLDIQEFTTDEISKLLNIKIASVYQRKWRAIKMIEVLINKS